MRGNGSSDLRRTSARKRSKAWFLLLFLFLSGCAPFPQAHTQPDLDHAYVVEARASYYELLTKTERELYGTLVRALNACVLGSSGFLPQKGLPAESDDLVRISRMVLYDHPEVSPFWYKEALQTRNDTELRIDPSDSPALMIPGRVYRFFACLFAGNSQAETAWKAFLFFARSCTYDEEAGLHSFDDYGALAERKATCQGASFLFKRCMDACGVPCVCFTGKTAEGALHMMTAIELDGAWYVCDLASALDQEHPVRYFCMSKDRVEVSCAQIVTSPGLIFP